MSSFAPKVLSFNFVLLLLFLALTNANPTTNHASPTSTRSPIYPLYIHDAGQPAPVWIDNATKWFNPNELPETIQVRTYDFTISRGLASPDGYQKHVLLING